MSAPKMHLEKSEVELIAMSCAGDRDAFYCLVQPCERGVFTAAMSILNNAADAEEVVQEAVMRFNRGQAADGHDSPAARFTQIGNRGAEGVKG